MNNHICKLKNYLSLIDKIEYHSSYCIVYSQEKTYYFKEIDYDIQKIYNYFQIIDFSYFAPLINSYQDSFLLCHYSKDGLLEKQKKGEKLIQVLSSLHNKSSISKNYEKNEKKKVYDHFFSIINRSTKYYLDLQDYIEEFDFPPPAYYLLIKNISKIHRLLHFSLDQLDNWYQSNDSSYCEVFLIENVCFDNFYCDEESYFYDYGFGKRGMAIYDLVSFYKKECFNLDMNSLFLLYNKSFQLQDGDISLFYSLISIPDKLQLKKESYQDTVRVRELVDYVDLTEKFLSEEYKKNQETNKNEFKKQDNNINFGSNEN